MYFIVEGVILLVEYRITIISVIMTIIVILLLLFLLQREREKVSKGA